MPQIFSVVFQDGDLGDNIGGLNYVDPTELDSEADQSDVSIDNSGFARTPPPGRKALGDEAPGAGSAHKQDLAATAAHFGINADTEDDELYDSDGDGDGGVRVRLLGSGST